MEGGRHSAGQYRVNYLVWVLGLVCPHAGGPCGVWLFWADPAWVKIAADAYAHRLLEASDNVATARQKQHTKATGSNRATT